MKRIRKGWHLIVGKTNRITKKRNAKAIAKAKRKIGYRVRISKKGKYYYLKAKKK